MSRNILSKLEVNKEYTTRDGSSLIVLGVFPDATYPIFCAYEMGGDMFQWALLPTGKRYKGRTTHPLDIVGA